MSDAGAGETVAAPGPAPQTPPQTPWARWAPGSARAFLLTETGGAAVLSAMVVVALVWSNLHPASYEGVWSADLALRLGPAGISMDLRAWVDQGLISLFFLVVGLEARRELDLGELRDRKRFVLPVAAGLVAMLVPVLVYLALNRHGPGAAGWGAAMSTDTALALGTLSLLGHRSPTASGSSCSPCSSSTTWSRWSSSRPRTAHRRTSGCWARRSSCSVPTSSCSVWVDPARPCTRSSASRCGSSCSRAASTPWSPGSRWA